MSHWKTNSVYQFPQLSVSKIISWCYHSTNKKSRVIYNNIGDKGVALHALGYLIFSGHYFFKIQIDQFYFEDMFRKIVKENKLFTT